MYNLPVFAETRVDVLHAFIRAHPLGTLITNGPQGPEATHLPFFLDAPSGLLRCHMARANPQWRQLQSGDRVLVSFVGRITTSRPLESRVPLKMRLPY
jgi:transcriptional regulator